MVHLFKAAETDRRTPRDDAGPLGAAELDKVAAAGGPSTTGVGSGGGNAA
jgi:hypothetical protein